MTTAGFIDFVGGNNANDGSTYANRVLTATSAGASAARTASTDWQWRIAKTWDPTQLTPTGTITNGGKSCVLSSSVIQVVKGNDATIAWTSVATHVSQATANTKQNDSGWNRTTTFDGTGMTGVAAYYTLPSTLDLSSYSLLNWQCRETSGTSIAASSIRLDLCSDTLGATPVDSFTITNIQNNQRWYDFALNRDGGGSLHSGIKSIAITCLNNCANASVNWGGFWASKDKTGTDCISLHTVFAINSAPSGLDYWYKVGRVSNDGLTIYFDSYVSQSSGVVPNVYRPSTSTSIAIYVRHALALTSDPGIDTVKAGIEGGPIVYSGGWDTSGNMVTQNGQTWLYCYPNVFGQRININNDWNNVDNVSFIGSNTGINWSSGKNCTFTDVWLMCGYGQVAQSSTQNKYLRVNILSQGESSEFSVGSYAYCESCHHYGSFSAGGGGSGAGFTIGKYSKLVNCVVDSMASTTVAGFNFTSSGQRSREYQLVGCQSLHNTYDVDSTTGDILAKDCIFNGTTVWKPTTASAGTRYSLFSHNHGQVAGTHKEYIGAVGLIVTSATIHAATGTSRKFSPLDSTYVSTRFPLRQCIFAYELNSGTTYTFTAWVQRDNTGLTMRIVCPIQGAAITTEVSQTSSAAINTWDQLTLSITPAATDVVCIYAEAYGGTTLNGYVHDLAIA
jgi:hypothetical protein